jgi:hypothetical protein
MNAGNRTSKFKFDVVTVTSFDSETRAKNGEKKTKQKKKTKWNVP